jgi:hypothetical protein
MVLEAVGDHPIFAEGFGQLVQLVAVNRKIEN